jgi:hypothetical protein
MKKNMSLCIVFLLFFLAGCATHKSWFSNPPVQTSGNDYYAVQFKPLKDDRKFFVSFHLTVTNKTKENLEIDWNKTLYIYDGRTNGRFMFQGLNSKNINNPPPDIILPGAALSKVIWPIKLIGYVPYRNLYVPVGQRGYERGIIPEGENGIYLVARQNQEEVTEKIMVKITSVDVQ